MLLITMFCYLFFYTGRHNFGWASKDLAGDLGISYALIGWISAGMLFGYAFGQLVNGNLADRFSPRAMILLGGVLSVMANVAISFSSDYLAILVLWTLNGYFQSLAWAPGSRLISNWWRPEERGKAFGLYTMAAGSSSVVTFLVSIVILNNGVEWPYLFRLPVLFLLFAVLLFYLVARDKPSELGFSDLYRTKQPNGIDSWTTRYSAVFQNKKFMIASVSLGFESMARYGLIVWVPLYFLGSSDGKFENLWGSLFLPIGMAVGALSFGFISDSLFKGNRHRSIFLGMAVAALVLVGIYVAPADNWPLGALLMFLAGFFVYGPQANFWPLSPDMLGDRLVGTGVGVMNTFAYLFAALGEPLLGKVIDLTDSASVFVALACICTLSAATILVSERWPSITGKSE
ncbi:Glycerol-3-phosphate transporter [Lunatimonas lonarensis]|uniref:Glycerol-3-phosphate transporter n=2 Tax=Lunatimonas lonarensis TaxID=1232681 RepID=R7ZNN8_9BACT|nr:Glycerol-3-phosphate transporter [Lunatimonas lonarensis]